MNKILLINRIDTNNLEIEDRKIFFLIGDMQKTQLEMKLMDTLDKVDFLSQEEIIYKYNGVEVVMKQQDIPKLLKILVESDFHIYSIYESYNPLT